MNHLFEPPDWLDREDEVLAPYAMRTRQSRGRQHPEEPHQFRTLYQRDRDRIVHSTAFRRLMYKTQVLVTQTNDHHRTRLTHTLEVAQISRTIARQLGLNEDLTEAIALAHDLGHPPFGHAGEEALNECMKDHGGFEHNRHALRIVELLEYRYADFPGLNLSWEVLEAQAQKARDKETRRQGDRETGRQGDRETGRQGDKETGNSTSSSGLLVSLSPCLPVSEDVGLPLLEAQVVDAADSLAYDTHDIDDALSVGLIAIEDLEEVEFWRRTVEHARQRHKSLGPEQFQPTVVRGLIEWQVADLLEHTRQRLRQERIRTVADVRGASGVLVGPGAEVRSLKAALEEFLHWRVYHHYRVQRMAAKGKRILRMLFDEYCRAPNSSPSAMPAAPGWDGFQIRPPPDNWNAPSATTWPA